MMNTIHVPDIKHVAALGVFAVAFLSAPTAAQTVPHTHYATWGIAASEAAAIPAGSIIADAVLTVKGIQPSDAIFEVYLLDNPAPGYVQNPKDNDSNSVFAEAGTQLAGTTEGSAITFRLSLAENDNDASWVWDVFCRPLEVALSRNRVLSYTSALLELMDYAGTGVSFGFGFEAAAEQAFEFTAIELTLTLSSYQNASPDRILTFAYSDGSTESTGKPKNPNASK